MNKILLALLSAGLVLPVLFAGCGENVCVEKEYDVTTKATVPVIDTYVPPAVETATFALG